MRNRTLSACVLAILAGCVDLARADDQPDKDSVELTVRGCVRGRDLTSTEISQPENVTNILGRTVRLTGKREVLDEVKRRSGRLVEVTGFVKKAALVEPGIKVGGTRIVIGSSPMSTDPTRNPVRDPIAKILAMEARTVKLVSDSCLKP